CGGQVQLWDTAAGSALAPPLPHSQVINVEFSRDGKRMVTGSWASTARVWDTTTGQPVTPPLKHDGAVLNARFSPNGRWVLTGSFDGTARLWDAQTGEPLGPALDKTDRIKAGAVSPDGRRVANLLQPGGVVLWDLPSERRPVDTLVQLAAVLSGERINPSGPSAMEPASLARTWNALRRAYPADFAPSPEEIARWHDRQVMERRFPPGSTVRVFHLGGLLAAAPADAELRFRRAGVYAALSRWAAAAADYARAIRLGMGDPKTGYFLALCQLAASNTRGYQQTCRALLAR